VQAAWQRSQAALQNNNIDQARRELAVVLPDAVMEQYARTIAHGGATRGEQGILISLNLRWLPYFLAQRQALGLDPLRVRFAPTAPEPLAQSPGKNTFAFDSERHLWQVLGAAETGAEVLPGTAGTPCSGGLKVDHAITISLAPLSGQELPQGKQELKFALSADSTVDVLIGGVHRVDANHNTVAINATGGRLNLTLRPVNTASSVCGFVLNQVASGSPGP
jgi:hypothetical protein